MKSRIFQTLAATCAILISASTLNAAINVETSFGGTAASPTGDTGLTGNWVTAAGGTTASTATFTTGNMPNLPDAYTNSTFVNSGNYIQTFGSPAFRSLGSAINVETASTTYFSFLYSVNGFDDVDGGGLSFFSGTTERVQVGLGDLETIRVFDVPNGVPAGVESTTKSFDTTNSEAIWIIGKITTAAGADSIDLTFFSGTDTVPASESWLITNNMTIGANLDTIRFNSPSSSGNVPQRFDEFRMGESWADVTAVPEPATFAIILGFLAIGWVGYRRRR